MNHLNLRTSVQPSVLSCFEQLALARLVLPLWLIRFKTKKTHEEFSHWEALDTGHGYHDPAVKQITVTNFIKADPVLLVVFKDYKNALFFFWLNEIFKVRADIKNITVKVKVKCLLSSLRHVSVCFNELRKLWLVANIKLNRQCLIDYLWFPNLR